VHDYAEADTGNTRLADELASAGSSAQFAWQFFPPGL